MIRAVHILSTGSIRKTFRHAFRGSYRPSITSVTVGRTGSVGTTKAVATLVSSSVGKTSADPVSIDLNAGIAINPIALGVNRRYATGAILEVINATITTAGTTVAEYNCIQALPPSRLQPRRRLAIGLLSEPAGPIGFSSAGPVFPKRR